MNEGRQKPTASEALTYLKGMKYVFEDKKDKYDEFLEIMKAFKDNRFDHVVPHSSSITNPYPGACTVCFFIYFLCYIDWGIFFILLF